MITDGKKWHYLVLKNLSRLFKGITSNHYGDFYCLNCFHSYRTKNKLEAHIKICENHDYCDCNWIRTHNHLVHKRTLNQASLAKWLSVRL